MRRFLLGAKTEVQSWTNPYITDGLVAMWDGEWNAGGGVHDGAATVWKDVAGQRDMSPTDSSLVSWEAKALRFDSSHWTDFNCGVSDLFIDSTQTEQVSRTIEVAFDLVAGNNNGGFLCFSVENAHRYLRTVYTGGTSFQDQFVGNNVIFSRGSAHGLSVAWNVVYRAASAGGSYAGWSRYADGVFSAQGTGAGGKPPVADIMRLGKGPDPSGSSVNDMRVHCIRLYSRALTESEVAANYAIDARRFGL